MRRLILAVALVAAAVGCGKKSGTPKGGGGGKPVPAAAAAKAKATGAGLDFHLSEGAVEGGGEKRLPPAAATPLGEAETKQLLGRLPPLPADPDQAKDFALRPSSLPAPRTGDTVKEAFPPAPEKPVPDVKEAGPLTILRHAPEGKVALAPNFSITFSQPMVAVTSHADALKTIPVTITPEVKGKFRWVGTKTLLFEPEARFPQATRYTVAIQAGTVSATGGKLAAASTFTFETPAPRMIGSYPSGTTVRDPLMLVVFDQRVNPAKVLAATHLSGHAKLRLATAGEVEASPELKAASSGAEKDRWVAFKPTELLPPDSDVTVTVGPHTPSAEGPLTTDEPSTFSFHTFGPFKLVKSQCGYDDQCPPMMPFSFEFTNPIDAKAFKKSLVHVEPELKGLHTEVYGTNLVIAGLTKGRTKYSVKIDGALGDRFGQKLGKDEKASFKVGSAQPSLSALGGSYVTLDPTAGPRFSVYTINYKELRVRGYAVGPSDWGAYQRYLEKLYDEHPLDPPGRRVISTTVKPDGDADELTETRIDLGPGLTGGVGQLVLVVEPTEKPKDRWSHPQVNVWVQATQIGLDAFADDTDLHAWANSLKDGKPLEGVELTIQPDQVSARSGADGLATLALIPHASDKPVQNLLVARKGADVAILPESSYYGGQGWGRRERNDLLRWFVFDDRQMYKPAEEVHLKGWIRRTTEGKGSDLVALAGAVTQVTYSVTDSRGNSVLTGQAAVNVAGGFDTSFKLPGTMNLGYTQVSFTASGPGVVDGRSYGHSIQVQEFRRPEFEVSASASEGPHLVGGHGTMTVSAKYYSGGALPGAEVTWNVSSSDGYFSPPNQDDFSFGNIIVPQRSYRYDEYDRGGGYGGEYQPPTSKSFVGHTDSSGKHHVRVDFDALGAPHAMTVSAQATVMDVNRQAWTASTSLVVHPAAEYVGLRIEKSFLQQGEPLEVNTIVADLDGKRVGKRKVTMKATRTDWEQEEGEWKEKEVGEQSCSVDSALEPVRCTFKTADGGEYRVRATIEDAQGRKNETDTSIWVAGGRLQPQRELKQEEVKLIADKKQYQPGDKAEVLVMAPFYPAEGVLTVRRVGVVEERRFTMDKPSDHAGRAGLGRLLPQRHGAGGSGRDCRAHRRPRQAQRQAAAPPGLRAREPGAVRAAARAHAGREGGAARRRAGAGRRDGGRCRGHRRRRQAGGGRRGRGGGGRRGDPVPDGLHDRRSDQHLLRLARGGRARSPLARGGAPGQPRGRHQAGGRARGEGRGQGGQGSARGFGGAAVAGHGRGPGRHQADGGHAGEVGQRGDRRDAAGPEADRGAHRLQRAGAVRRRGADRRDRARQGRRQAARQPDALPRDRGRRRGRPPLRTRRGDDHRAPAAHAAAVAAALPQLRRQLRAAHRGREPDQKALLEVDVAVRATNAELTAGQGRRMTVAGERPRRGALPGRGREGGHGALPDRDLVGQRSPTRPGGAAGVDAGHDRGLRDLRRASTKAARSRSRWRCRPACATQFGGLEVTTSSTELQALTDAVLYLVAYRFECAEQLSSRILAVAALRDVLSAFQAEGMPTPEDMIAASLSDIERLRGMQNSRRRLRLLEARRRDVALPHDPRDARARAGQGEGLRGAREHAQRGQGLSAQHREPLSLLVLEQEKRDADRVRPVRAQAHGRRGPGAGAAPARGEAAPTACRSRRWAGSCRSCPRTRPSQDDADKIRPTSRTA